MSIGDLLVLGLGGSLCSLLFCQMSRRGWTARRPLRDRRCSSSSGRWSLGRTSAEVVTTAAGSLSSAQRGTACSNDSCPSARLFHPPESLLQRQACRRAPNDVQSVVTTWECSDSGNPAAPSRKAPGLPRDDRDGPKPDGIARRPSHRAQSGSHGHPVQAQRNSAGVNRGKRAHSETAGGGP